MLKLKRIKQSGSKRRFIVYGALNVGITNLILQILLFFVPTGLATFLSQLFNMAIGFFLYGKKVFRVKQLKQKAGVKYFLLATSLWIANWIGINAVSQYGISRNLAAILLVPILATYSYLAQMLVVFSEE